MNRSLLLHRYAVATAAATFLLLIAGGLVTSTDSGLAVPDWPLSYGTWMPPMVGGILYEHGHRMIAATVGLMILVLAVWLGWVAVVRVPMWIAATMATVLHLSFALTPNVWIQRRSVTKIPIAQATRFVSMALALIHKSNAPKTGIV